MAIENGDLATIFVRVLDLRDNIVDGTGDEGVKVRVGSRDVFPRLDKALLGLEQNGTLDLVLEPEESFGDFDPDLIHLAPASSLGVEKLKKGMRFSHVPGIPGDGAYTVTDTADGVAVLDGNHPYAGWTLRFLVKVLRYEKGAAKEADDSDIFIPDFLKCANPEVEEEGEVRLEIDEARSRLAKEEAEEAAKGPAKPMGTGLFTSLVPDDGKCDA